MKSSLAWLGAAALALWTLGGLVAWGLAADGVTLVFQEGAPEQAGRTVEDDPLDDLLTRTERLSGEHRALGEVLEQNLQVLDERGDARASEFERALAGLRGELRAGLDTLEERLTSRPLVSGEPMVTARDASDAETAAHPAGAAGDPASGLAVAGRVQAPPLDEADTRVDPAPAPRSFLAFRLPADDFRFDQRRTWRLDPERSRVGFDARSTLHDFSGTSSQIAGEIELDPSRAGDSPRGEVRVTAASLRTGSEGRDEAMLEHLDVAHHPELVFHLERFEPERVDPGQRTLTGTVRGTMDVRGVEHPLAMPVRVALDSAHRLSIEGQATLSLPDHGVPVPNKLGVISMEPEVTVWIALRAELQPRSEP